MHIMEIGEVGHMKQETLRKLRHRILAGMLCFSIVFVAQPDNSNISTLWAAGNLEESEYTGENPDLSIGSDSKVIPVLADAEENKNEFPDSFRNELQLQDGTEGIPEEDKIEDQTEEGVTAEASTEPEAVDMDATEENLIITADALLTEPQADTIHQHSVSTDCSISAGEQVFFTELPQDFTGGELPEGNYYLKEDVTLDSSMEISSGVVTLCLNGHTLRYGGTGKNSVINVNSNANLHICDCSPAGGRISGGKNSGIRIEGFLNLYGGTISGNVSETGGGGIYNYNGNVKMLNGTITGNSVVTGNAEGNGGGVCVNSGSFNK